MIVTATAVDVNEQPPSDTVTVYDHETTGRYELDVAPQNVPPFNDH